MVAKLADCLIGAVALLAEGVDRNAASTVMQSFTKKSPSSQRAWIEISERISVPRTCVVALLAEGVDRNKITISDMFIGSNVALLAEGVDRNLMAKGILLFL